MILWINNRIIPFIKKQSNLLNWARIYKTKGYFENFLDKQCIIMKLVLGGKKRIIFNLHIHDCEPAIVMFNLTVTTKSSFFDEFYAHKLYFLAFAWHYSRPYWKALEFSCSICVKYLTLGYYVLSLFISQILRKNS